MKIIEDVYYTGDKHEMQMLDVYLPEKQSFPVLVYFHGGGFIGGCRKDFVFFSHLVEMGVAVVSVEYRMYPDALYPDFIRDAAASVAWAQKNMTQYGNIEGIFIGGSSAGGYLTQILCFDKKYLALHDIDADSITGYIMDAGQPTVHFNVLKERGLDLRRVIIDEAAPIFHISDERNYPPMKIIVSDNDIENRYEQTCLLVSTLKHFGFEEKVDFNYIKNSNHCEYVNKISPDGRSVFADMVYDFISKTLKETD